MSDNNKRVELEISSFLGEFEVDDTTIEKIEQLEDYIRQANTVANLKNGELLVVDAIYDEMIDLLKQVNPESELLQELWELSDEDNIEGQQYTELLETNPMKSIMTVKSFTSMEMKQFETDFPDGQIDLNCTVKMNGWGVRIVYQDGVFVSGTSRARSSAGRDLTRQLSIILEKDGLLELPEPFNEGLIEIRGEILLPLSNLEEARQHNSSIVSAFSGVSSMIRDSAKDEEISLLDFVAYNIIGEEFEFEKQSDMLAVLELTIGFKTPLSWSLAEVERDELVEVLEDVIEEFSDDVFNEECPYDYFTDGVVVQVDDYQLFNSMGGDTKYNSGNIALKVGMWSQDNYYGYVQYIEYSKGKSKLSPVAIVSTEPNHAQFDLDGDLYNGIDDLLDSGIEIDKLNYSLSDCVDNYKELGVGTASGNRVRRVPLYEPINLIRLDVKPNSLLHFKYGGEAGVVPCFDNGSLLKDTKGKEFVDSVMSEEDELYDDGWV